MKLRILALVFALATRVFGYDVTVTGATTGIVWGTGIYTHDSNIATAAVHAGLIAPGQTALITVTSLPGQSSYTGSTANGVTTYSYGSWYSSISLSLASGGSTPPTIQFSPGSGITQVNGVLTAYTGSQITISLSASDADGDLNHVNLMSQGDSFPWASWTISGGSYSNSATLTTPTSPTTWVLRGVVDDQAGNTGDSGWYTIQIVNPNTNSAPTASISGPASLTTGQDGTWNYSASDSNANLYRWRQVIAGVPQAWSYISGGSASSSLTMSFVSAGTHTITIEVEDSNGATGTASTSVVVTAPPATSLPYTVSSSYAAHYTYPALAPNYTYLNDGLHDNSYGYASDTAAANWLMADFGSAKRITKVHVGGGMLAGWAWASDYSDGSILQYSSDGTNWSTAYTFSTGYSKTGTSVSIDMVARYWRLYRTSWFGTTEFRFEGTAVSQPSHTISVVNGTSSGQSSVTATEGTVFPITANPPPGGQLFSQWTKSGPGTLAVSTSASTNFTVGNGAATLTANYAANTAPTASIGASGATTIAAGSTATILYSSSDSTSNLSQWRVSLLPNSANWTPIAGGSQSAQFNYTFPTAGAYTFKLEVVDTLGASATAQLTFTVQSQVSVTPNPVAPGQTVTVSYTGAPTTSSWLGIYSSSGSDTSPIKSGSVPSAGSGSVNFAVDSLLPPGTYNARLFQATGGYVKLGTSGNFTVQAAATYSLTVNGGTGSASGLSANAQVAIQATPPAGMAFSHWSKSSADGGYFFNAYSPSTSYALNGASAVVQANFTTNTDPNADNDSDGLPNGWESSYGLNPASASDALLDPDNDGLNNLAEYNLGTSPLIYNPGAAESGPLAKPAGWAVANTANTQVVGATVGQASVDASGAFTYSIPLWTTPGSSGMEPKVALNYSSQSGNGIAGFGWSLSGVSAITRGPQSKVIDGANRGASLTAADRFYLDGQRLVLVAGIHGAPNSEYRTEIDSISRIVANGSAGSGPASFTVYTKAGLILQFGQTADSALDAMSSGAGEAAPTPRAEKVSWHVNRITDTTGSFMTFEYEEDAVQGSHRLHRINYTGNGGIAPYASLRFEYEARPDWSQGYFAGSPLSNTVRLKTVKSYFGESVARTYTLNYRVNSGTQLYTNRSILTSLVETGSDGKSYPPLPSITRTTPTAGPSRTSTRPPTTSPTTPTRDARQARALWISTATVASTSSPGATAWESIWPNATPAPAGSTTPTISCRTRSRFQIRHWTPEDALWTSTAMAWSTTCGGAWALAATPMRREHGATPAPVGKQPPPRGLRLPRPPRMTCRFTERGSWTSTATAVSTWSVTSAPASMPPRTSSSTSTPNPAGSTMQPTARSATTSPSGRAGSLT